MERISLESIKADRTARRTSLRRITLAIIAGIFFTAVMSGIVLSSVTIFASIFFALVAGGCVAVFIHVATHSYFK